MTLHEAYRPGLLAPNDEPQLVQRGDVPQVIEEHDACGAAFVQQQLRADQQAEVLLRVAIG